MDCCTRITLPVTFFFEQLIEKVEVEIIDLNRMRFGNVGIEAGCKNFERLPGTHEMFAILAEEYDQTPVVFDVTKLCLVNFIEQAHSSFRLILF